MKQFAALFTELDETNRTGEKVDAMVRYFSSTPAADAAWAVSFLIGRRPKRLVQAGKLFRWAASVSGIPEWLFSECYDAVGDLAETIALALPDPQTQLGDRESLAHWVTERLLVLAGLPEEMQQSEVIRAWAELGHAERFVWNKLITGGFRVGVSQELVTRALSVATGLAPSVIAHRLMGDWTPSASFFTSLTAMDEGDAEVSRPYPFCLAYPIEGAPEGLGNIAGFHCEWKWDGIRAQVIRRGGKSFVWSRGEEVITDRFPEVAGIAESLPNGTVLDGEILAWSHGKPLRFMELQKRIGRRTLSKKILQEVPAVLVAFDLLEDDGVDIRQRPFSERRGRLEELVTGLNRVSSDGFAELLGLPRPKASHMDAATDVDARLAVDTVAEEGSASVIRTESRLLLATSVDAKSWDELLALRGQARELNVEGFMIKRLDAPYQVGRKKGVWWKWKIDPYTVDAVLIYAQRGHGKRASLYTDYTFGIWSEGKLVPFAKAYSGLDDDEIRRVDAFVRQNTLEKFGPVRTVSPQIVMELAFEGIQLSTRHKSGIAVRFPRIARWRHDKLPRDADSLESVKALIRG